MWPARRFDAPVVLIIGTSMESAKQRREVGRAPSQGPRLRVAAVKLTGAGHVRDILAMRDAGADAIFDSSTPDCHRPSSSRRRRAALLRLLSQLSSTKPSIIIAEQPPSPLEPYNGDVALRLPGRPRPLHHPLYRLQSIHGRQHHQCLPVPARSGVRPPLPARHSHHAGGPALRRAARSTCSTTTTAPLDQLLRALPAARFAAGRAPRRHLERAEHLRGARAQLENGRCFGPTLELGCMAVSASSPSSRARR